MSRSSSYGPSTSMIRQYIQLFAGFVARSIFDQQGNPNIRGVPLPNCRAVLVRGQPLVVHFKTSLAYTHPMHLLKTLIAILVLAGIAAAQEHVSFPTEDGGLI